MWKWLVVAIVAANGAAGAPTLPQFLLRQPATSVYLKGIKNRLPKGGFVEGDMIMTRERVEMLYGKKVADAQKDRVMSGEKGRGLGVTSEERLKWDVVDHHGIIVVPYVFDEGPYAIPMHLRTKVEWVFYKLSEKLKGVRFVRWNKAVPDFLVIMSLPKMGCGAIIGREGGPQFMTLEPFCFEDHIIEHEALHVLGIYHEQSRPDRDKYVNVNLANVPEDKHSQFAIRQTIDSKNSPYDLGSLMHYDEYAFAIDNKVKTIESKDPSKPIKNPKQASSEDLRQTRELYGVENLHRVPSIKPRRLCSFYAKCGFDAYKGGMCVHDSECKSGLVCQRAKLEPWYGPYYPNECVPSESRCSPLRPCACPYYGVCHPVGPCDTNQDCHPGEMYCDLSTRQCHPYPYFRGYRYIRGGR